MMILPRQARDKHRKTTQKKTVLSQHLSDGHVRATLGRAPDDLFAMVREKAGGSSGDGGGGADEPRGKRKKGKKQQQKGKQKQKRKGA